jgi:hypothetical protein
MAGRAGWIIYRPQQTRFRIDIGDNFLLVPDVVARRHDRGTRAQQIDGNLRRDPSAARRVLTIYHYEIRSERFLEARQMGDDSGPSRLAHDIA